MKNTLLIIFGFLNIHLLSAQIDQIFCNTVSTFEVSEIDQRQYEYDISHHFERYSLGDTIIIPTVVHNLYCQGFGFVEDSVILSTIKEVNDALANRGDFYHPEGVDTKFRLKLVKKKPNGASTTGINHIHHEIGCGEYYINSEFSEDIQWDIYHYFNVYLGLGGISGGVSNITNGKTSDWYLGNLYGILINISILNQNLGTEIITHEIGHFLGLYHTFGQGNSGGTCYNGNCLKYNDKVCDTPPDYFAWTPCVEMNSCNTDVNPDDPYNQMTEDQNDMNDNFMDYSPCGTRFTPGQSARMHWIYEHYLYTLGENIENRVWDCPEIIAKYQAVDKKAIVNEPFLLKNTTNAEADFSWYVDSVLVGNSRDISIVQDTPGIKIIRLEAKSRDSLCNGSWVIEKSFDFKCSNQNIDIDKPSIFFTDSCYQIHISNAEKVQWTWNSEQISDNTLDLCLDSSGIFPISVQYDIGSCSIQDSFWIPVTKHNKNQIRYFKDELFFRDTILPKYSRINQIKKTDFENNYILSSFDNQKSYLQFWNTQLDSMISWQITLKKTPYFRNFDIIDILKEGNNLYFIGRFQGLIIGKINTLGQIEWAKVLRLENLSNRYSSTANTYFLPNKSNSNDLSIFHAGGFYKISKKGAIKSIRQWVTLPDYYYEKNRDKKLAFTNDRIWFANIANKYSSENYIPYEKSKESLSHWGLRIGSMKYDLSDLKVSRYDNSTLNQFNISSSNVKIKMHPSGNAVVFWEIVNMQDNLNLGYTMNIAMANSTGQMLWMKSYYFDQASKSNPLAGTAAKIECLKNGDIWVTEGKFGNAVINILKFNDQGELLSKKHISNSVNTFDKDTYASTGSKNTIHYLDNGILTGLIETDIDSIFPFKTYHQINQFIPYDSKYYPCDTLSFNLEPIVDNQYKKTEPQEIIFRDVRAHFEDIGLEIKKSLTGSIVHCDTIINLEDYTITLTDTTYHCPDSMTLTLNICRYESGTPDSVRLLTFNKSPLDTAATMITNDFIHFNDTETCKTVTITSDIHDYHFALNTKPDYKTPFTIEPSFYDANERLESDYKNNFLDIVQECQMVATHDVVVPPSISVFPNPAKDIINIEMQNGMMQRVNIYNMMGQLVISKNIGSYSAQIDIKGLSDGVYFLDVYGRDGMAIREKVVVFE